MAFASTTLAPVKTMAAASDDRAASRRASDDGSVMRLPNLVATHPMPARVWSGPLRTVIATELSFPVSWVPPGGRGIRGGHHARTFAGSHQHCHSGRRPLSLRADLVLDERVAALCQGAGALVAAGPGAAGD